MIPISPRHGEVSAKAGSGSRGDGFWGLGKSGWKPLAVSRRKYLSGRAQLKANGCILTSRMGQKTNSGSIMDFCTLLCDEGKIDATTYQRASSFLHRQSQIQQAKIPSSILNGSIYIDRLALSYLQSTNLLQPIAASSLDIRIHPDVLYEMQSLIEAGDVGDDLINRIERIRHILQNAVASGSASFLPHAGEQTERIQNREIRFQATASLLAGSAACDVLCIDDRFINSHPVLAVSPERSVPIVCVLDVLRYLVSRGCIGVVDHWTARHKLRAGSFAFIPLESDELVHWLKGAKVSNGQLTESAELRVLRQTMARIDGKSKRENRIVRQRSQRL